ncbi:NADPH-dependent F420 reductase [Pseudonocardia sp. N23]|uniref:NADPH-dependent F420 reductase n=1 Tax=Pseudonocardia sp. N23 TaxID=1987376 RepID=UPI000BFD4F8A|nr:NAD(P)-binding domain-containing protein [Pseudonocardia sp. N23]GAY13076.1 putative reductase [Pseudonocardia sp. N23]
MSSITIIGTGNMARAIGTLAIAGGNAVEVMGRDQAKADGLAEALGATAGEWGAVPAGDIVITALLHDAVVPAVIAYGDALAGKVVVDISNPFNATFDGLAHSEETSVAQKVAEVAPGGADVVKAFNTIFRNVLENGRPDVFIAADSAQAKASVKEFVEGIGLRPLDVGGLAMAHWLEGMGLVTVGLAGNGVGHWDFALGVDEFERSGGEQV